MSSSELAISARGLGKAYTIRHNRTDHVTLTEVALDRIQHPLRRSAREEFWALRDIELDVARGEVLGIVGRNGAGKSTLLKILSRITEPTTGEVRLWGRVGSLLEVGTGFHPELTGRENVYLNGSILGMGRKEIDRQFDAIVDFAGVERFLDTPVKRYSSGMYVRLAFAVAAHLETDVLLLDEVLAVGDTDFQAKSLEKVSEVSSGGRTVLIVSHNMTSIRRFASRALLLSNGAVEMVGDTEGVLAAYGSHSLTTSVDVADHDRSDPSHGTQVRIMAVELLDAERTVTTADPIRYRVEIDAYETTSGLRIAQAVRMTDGQVHSTSFGSECIDVESGGRYSIDVELPHHSLPPGMYILNIDVGHGGPFATPVSLDSIASSVVFEVVPEIDDKGAFATWHSQWWGDSRLPQPEVAVREIGQARWSATRAGSAAPSEGRADSSPIADAVEWVSTPKATGTT